MREVWGGEEDLELLEEDAARVDVETPPRNPLVLSHHVKR